MCVLIATLRQSVTNNKKYKASNFSRTPALKGRPQVKGIVNRVTTMSPKKPNSAVRHIAKVTLTSSRRLTARIPGIGYLCSKYNRVLVTGGRANDLPGVGYTLVRGVYDFSPVISKKKEDQSMEPPDQMVILSIFENHFVRRWFQFYYIYLVVIILNSK